jgi:uncharacterized membrane protein YgaE (UPF0421/DUF939 family)
VPRIVQAALAAGVAFVIAKQVIGHEDPFFAPIAAVLTLGLAIERRGRRAYEIALGVALGIGIADLILLATGTGTWQIALVVALAMAAAVLLGGGVLLVNQAAVSAVLVAALPTPDVAVSAERFVDALMGSGAALAANALMPVDPIRHVRRELEPLLARLSGTLVDVADALATADLDAAREALDRARELDAAVRELEQAIGAGIETTTIAPSRRRSRASVERFARAAGPIDLVVRNTRVLARAAVRAIDLGDNVPPIAVDAVRDLAAAVRGLDRHLVDPSADSTAVALALRAAARATAALEGTANMSVNVIVGQVRSTSTDLLLGLGLPRDAAVARVRSARAELEL